MTRAVLLACATLAMSCVSAADLPRCDKNLKVAHLSTDPQYPPGRLQEGTVLVEFTVDVQGHVSDPKIAQSSNEKLNNTALKEAVKLRFVPPQQACRHRVPITFRMSD